MLRTLLQNLKTEDLSSGKLRLLFNTEQIRTTGSHQLTFKKLGFETYKV